MLLRCFEARLLFAGLKFSCCLFSNTSHHLLHSFDCLYGSVHPWIMQHIYPSASTLSRLTLCMELADSNHSLLPSSRIAQFKALSLYQVAAPSGNRRSAVNILHCIALKRRAQVHLCPTAALHTIENTMHWPQCIHCKHCSAKCGEDGRIDKTDTILF